MIHIFEAEEGEEWEVWSDTEVTEKDGRCIGVGATRAEALKEAS